MRKDKELDNTYCMDITCEMSNDYRDDEKLFSKCDHNICFRLCLILDTDELEPIAGKKLKV